MTQAAQAASRTPWHLWLVGAIAVLWNGYACYDYVMMQIGGADYLRQYDFTEAQIQHYTTMPAWATALWAIGVWGGALGGLLLLLRRKWAVHAFAASLAAFVLNLVYTYVLSDAAAVMGSEMTILNGVIGALCVFFAWYAWFARKRGLLR
jgi:hypothetical protein